MFETTPPSDPKKMLQEQAEAFLANCPVRILLNKPTEAQAEELNRLLA